MKRFPNVSATYIGMIRKFIIINAEIYTFMPNYTVVQAQEDFIKENNLKYRI